MLDLTQVLTLLKMYGPTVVFLVLLITGWVVPRGVYMREVDRATSYDRIAQAALAALAKIVNPPQP
jgi:hypothetical protein